MVPSRHWTLIQIAAVLIHSAALHLVLMRLRWVRVLYKNQVGAVSSINNQWKDDGDLHAE
jgi:hypothetical protein